MQVSQQQQLQSSQLQGAQNALQQGSQVRPQQMVQQGSSISNLYSSGTPTLLTSNVVQYSPLFDDELMLNSFVAMDPLFEPMALWKSSLTSAFSWSDGRHQSTDAVPNTVATTNAAGLLRPLDPGSAFRSCACEMRLSFRRFDSQADKMRIAAIMALDV